MAIRESGQIHSVDYFPSATPELSKKPESYEQYRPQLQEILQRYFLPSDAKILLDKLLGLATAYNELNVLARTNPTLERNYFYDEAAGTLVANNSKDLEQSYIVCPDGKWLLESLIKQELQFVTTGPGHDRVAALNHYITEKYSHLALSRSRLEAIGEHPDLKPFVPGAFKPKAPLRFQPKQAGPDDITSSRVVDESEQSQAA